MSILSAPSFYNQADQNIFNQGFSFIPQERFRGGAFNIPLKKPEDEEGGITTLLPTSNMGGGGGGIPFSGTTGDLQQNFFDTTTNRQDRLNNPPDRFFGFKTMKDLPATEASSILAENIGIPQEQTFAGKVQDFLTPQSADDIIAGGYEPKVNFGILSNLLPDRYGELPRGDQAFIARNMGYTGPTVFGENTSGLSKDIFGLNTRSGFGNYAERVGKEYASLGESLSGRLADKYGAEFDEETGMFVGPNAAIANQMTKMMRAKYNFYGQQTKQRDADRQAALDRQIAEQGRANLLANRNLTQAQRDQERSNINRVDRAYREETGGQGGSYATGESGQQSDGSYNDPFDPGGGEKDGGFIDGTNRRMDFMMGGLANLVDIYD
mgnify:CR=1 FL=1|tara:strand:+ start:208 stop:1350 length:1143 start_codon:yes stop_codon:yes gene_type:complete